MDNDSVKQSSCKNFLKDTASNLWPEKFGHKVNIWRLMIYMDENLIFLCRPAHIHTRLAACTPKFMGFNQFFISLKPFECLPCLERGNGIFGSGN
jgi:hypothetical protein